MLILILNDVQYLQNVVFSFVKSLYGQIHSSDSHRLIEKSSQQDFPFPSGGIPPPLNVI